MNGCDVHCPRPSGSGRPAAVVIAAVVAVVVVHQVLGAWLWGVLAALGVLSAAGVAYLRHKLRGARTSTRAEVLYAALAVRGVGPDRKALAARARPVRGELAAPAVRLVQVLPAEEEVIRQ